MKRWRSRLHLELSTFTSIKQNFRFKYDFSVIYELKEIDVLHGDSVVSQKVTNICELAYNFIACITVANHKWKEKKTSYHSITRLVDPVLWYSDHYADIYRQIQVLLSLELIRQESRIRSSRWTNCLDFSNHKGN